MEKIMNIKYGSAGLILILLLIFVSCTKDFTEINTNPNNFTTASDGALFNDVISSLELGWNEQF